MKYSLSFGKLKTGAHHVPPPEYQYVDCLFAAEWKPAKGRVKMSLVGKMYVYLQLNKNIKDGGVQNCHSETMMNTKVDKTVKKVTHHVSLRQMIST